MHTFQISLPTGTKVHIYKHWRWEGVLNVAILPSLVDIEKSSGLCGNFDGERSNDVETVDDGWSAVLSPTDTLKYKYESIKRLIKQTDTKRTTRHVDISVIVVVIQHLTFKNVTFKL